MIRSLFLGLATLAVPGLLTSVTLRGGELATATISSTPTTPAGNSQYNVTLNDTGTTTLGTFWFGWIPGDNFMAVSPTSVTSPSGWQEQVTHGGPSNGFAIQWTAMTAANDLSAGGSLAGFSFDSALTLAQLESPSVGSPSDWVDTAFVYSGAPFSDAGVQITPTAAVTGTPEPSAFALAILGGGALLIGVSRRMLPAKRFV